MGNLCRFFGFDRGSCGCGKADDGIRHRGVAGAIENGLVISNEYNWTHGHSRTMIVKVGWFSINLIYNRVICHKSSIEWEL